MGCSRAPLAPPSAPAAASTAHLWASGVARPCKTSFPGAYAVGRSAAAFASVPLLLGERVVNDATGGTSRKVEGGLCGGGCTLPLRRRSVGSWSGGLQAKPTARL